MKLYKLYEQVLGEAEYNYHRSKGDNVDTTKTPVPHFSDDIFRMSGRDTGHFGSGMYFQHLLVEKRMILTISTVNIPILTLFMVVETIHS